MIVTLEAPALAAGDERGERAVRALERAFPDARLVGEVGEHKGRSTLTSRESDRESWLRTAAGEGKIPMVSTYDPDPLLFYADNHTIAFPSGEAILLGAVCHYPKTEETVARSSEALSGLGTALGAYWGVATPFAAAAKIGTQVRPPGSDRRPPPGLPQLSPIGDLAGPAVPQKLGWLNYWSAETAQLLGFPDPARDAEWLSRAQKLENGAWLLSLTDEPLHLEETEHLAALIAAYARFRQVGRPDRG
jgi:hypothetical protein